MFWVFDDVPVSSSYTNICKYCIIGAPRENGSMTAQLQKVRSDTVVVYNLDIRRPITMSVENETSHVVSFDERVQNVAFRKLFAPILFLGAFLLAGSGPNLSSYRDDIQHVNGIFDATNQTSTATKEFHIESEDLDESRGVTLQSDGETDRAADGAPTSQQPAVASDSTPFGGSIGTSDAVNVQAADIHDSRTFNDQRNSTRPYLILHAGPPKTGTTSIQCGLQKNFEALMELDNYYYLGIDCVGERGMSQNPMSFKLFRIVGNINGAKEGNFDPYVMEFLAALESHRSQGHNVVVSSEHIVSLLSDGMKAQNNWRKFASMLPGFQTKAVLVQRNLVDWFPSLYYQYHLLAKPPPSFQDYLLKSLRGWEQGSNATAPAFKKHVDQRRALKMLSSYFEIDVMDFYSDQYKGALFHRFVCQHLPNATGTCNLLDAKQQEAEVRAAADNRTSTKASTAIHARKSKSLHDARIVFFAEETHQYFNMSDMTDKELGQARGKNRALTNRILDQYDVLVEGSNFLDCLPSDMESRLKSISTSCMQAFHQQKYGRSMNERELEMGRAAQDLLFEKNRMKYCDVNMERLFANATIKELLLQDMVPKSRRS